MSNETDCIADCHPYCIAIVCRGPKPEKPTAFFFGFNPVAPFTSLPNQFANLYLPLLSNLETGLALNGGIILRQAIIESRISYGKPNELFRLFQFHSGYNHFFSRKTHSSGLYAGGFIKYYHLLNIRNRIRNSSIIPYLAMGYRMEYRNMFFDFRLNQNVYAISWSNRENTGMNSGFHFSVCDDISPVLPYLCINLGYVIENRKRR